MAVVIPSTKSSQILRLLSSSFKSKESRIFSRMSYFTSDSYSKEISDTNSDASIVRTFSSESAIAFLFRWWTIR